MNKCKYKIDTALLEEIRFKEGVSIFTFKERFITRHNKPLAYTTYYNLLKKGICTGGTMNAIKAIYPEAIGFLSD